MYSRKNLVYLTIRVFITNDTRVKLDTAVNAIYIIDIATTVFLLIINTGLYCLHCFQANDLKQ